jgi:hypothetical protein
MNSESTREASVARYNDITDVWIRHCKYWYFIYYALGILSIVLSTLVASRPKWFGWSEDFFGVLAWTMAVVTGVSTFLNAGERGDRFKQAWVILSAQLTRFKVERTYTVDHVLDAHSQGEALIHPASSAAVYLKQAPKPS